jgi:DNA-binding FrmR family transcriptional regulator
MDLTAEQKRKLLARLRRAEGQVAAVRRMVESDAYCVDVLTQLSASRGALGKVGETVLQHHIETCVTEAFQSGRTEVQQEKVEELMDVFSRYSGLGG